MKKTIIFDFDGVIVDSFQECLAVRRLYDPGISDLQYRQLFCGNIFETSKNRGVTRPSEFDSAAEYTKRILPIKPNAGIRRVLNTLLENNFSLYIVSSTSSKFINSYLKKYKLEKYFLGVLGGEIHPSKVEKFKLIASKKNLNIHEFFFVTDTLGDLIEGDKAGVQNIAVTYGFHTRQILTSVQTNSILIDNINELSKIVLHD